MFWDLYIKLSYLVIGIQILFLIQSIRNYNYAINKTRKDRNCFRPKTLLTVPCKGIDKDFDRNIRAFIELDYRDYTLHFVVQAADDPAYERLNRIIAANAQNSQAKNIRVLIAGIASGCSQKIHNLLYSCANAPEDTEVLAFADSDAYMTPAWLNNLVHPLRFEKYGASSGYRWFVPLKNNLATMALSSVNAKVAQFLGNSHFNQAWGGSMAITTKLFDEIQLDKAWAGALSDDLCLSYMVKRSGKKVVFVPGCLVASYEVMTWPQVFEFGRRQFLITRIATPGTWWFGLLSTIVSLLGSWGALFLLIGLIIADHPLHWVYFVLPAVFFSCQSIRAWLRQKMIVKLLPNDAENMKKSAVADIAGSCLWSWLLLGCIISSACGRKITWRGITYKLISPTKTEIIKPG